MAVLEYLNENNEWKKVNAYGVSSVNGQQGDVKITPESIGAPTRDRVEKLDRELQERLETFVGYDFLKENGSYVDLTSEFKIFKIEQNEAPLSFIFLRQENNFKFYADSYLSTYYCNVYLNNQQGKIIKVIQVNTEFNELQLNIYQNEERIFSKVLFLNSKTEDQISKVFFHDATSASPKENNSIVNKEYVDTEISKLPKVYIGSGEMPEDCDIQFDFDEEPPIEVLTPINLSNYTYTKEQIDTMFGEYVTDIDILIGGGAE